MKRLIPLVLALALILAMTGCIYTNGDNGADLNTPVDGAADGKDGTDAQAPSEIGGETDDGKGGVSDGASDGGETDSEADNKTDSETDSGTSGDPAGDAGGQDAGGAGTVLSAAPGTVADALASAAGEGLQVVSDSSPADTLKAGGCDAAVVTVSQAARLYRESGGANIAALLTSGGWIVAEKGDTITNMLGLGGKVIYAPSDADEAAAVLGYIAGQYGFELGNTLVIETVSDPENRDTALLPEGGTGDGQRSALSLLAEWEYATGRELLPGLCLAVSSDMGDDELEALLDAVGTALDGASDTDATKFVFITGAQRLRETLEDHMELLYGIDPDVLGGSIPDDGFYR